MANGFSAREINLHEINRLKLRSNVVLNPLLKNGFAILV